MLYITLNTFNLRIYHSDIIFINFYVIFDFAITNHYIKINHDSRQDRKGKVIFFIFYQVLYAKFYFSGLYLKGNK